MRKYKIHITFLLLFIYGFRNVGLESAIGSPSIFSALIAGAAFGSILIIICLLIGCISFLTNRGKSFWDFAFATSVLLIILFGLGELASINAFN